VANLLTVDALGVNNGVRVNEREKLVRYKLTLSGLYVQHVRGTAVGEVLDLTKVVLAGNAPDQLWGPVGPSRLYVLNAGGTGYLAVDRSRVQTICTGCSACSAASPPNWQRARIQRDCSLIPTS
jgi:hypothetical protein